MTQQAKSTRNNPSQVALSALVSEIFSDSEQHRLILDSLPVIIAYIDKSYRYRFSNRAHQEHWRKSREQIIGHHAANVMGPQNYAEARPYIEQALAGEDTVFEVRIDYPAYGVRYVRINYLPHFDSNKDTIGCFVLAQDLSDQKFAEEALRLSEERFRRLIEKTKVIPWEAELNTSTFTYVGPQAESILGYPLEEWFKPNFWIEHIHPDDRELATQICLENSRTKSCYELEYRMLHFNSHEIWVRDLITVIKEPNGNQYLQGFLIDITRSKEAELEKLELERQLRHSQKMEALGKLAGGIAHDFNNLLGGIIGYSELALHRESSDPILRKYVDLIHTSSYRAKDLVNQILSFSQRSKPEIKDIDLSQVVNEVLLLAQATIPATIQIEFDFPNEPLLTRGDSSQLHQVFLNICTNAAHAMEEYGGRLIVKIEPTYVDIRKSRLLSNISCGKYVKVSFRDTGHGMDEETKKRLFEPYFTTKKPGKGSGLGLAVAHGIIANHEGAIAVSSKLGKGSCFSIVLPLQTSQAIIQGAPSKSPQVGRGKILFVDDEAILAQLGKDMLETLGYEVTTFTQSLQALKYFTDNYNNINLVISDQSMPDMTGEELITELKKICPDIPTILCSGFGTKNSSSIYNQTPNNDFYLLSKPFSIQELSNTVALAIDSSID